MSMCCLVSLCGGSVVCVLSEKERVIEGFGVLYFLLEMYNVEETMLLPLAVMLLWCI